MGAKYAELKGRTVTVVINPRRACAERVTVLVRSVSVCYQQICCLHRLCLENKVSWGSSWFFLGFCRKAFAENTSFESYGIICWSPTSSFVPGERLMDKHDGNGFFSTQKECVVSRTYTSNKITSSLLIIVH